MPLATGEKLGPYEILAPIGAGGMGEVYRALDTRLGREVAIKVSTERLSERMEREARAIAALNHPHIATLYDVGEHEGSLYLAMEFVKGAPLKGPCDVRDAIGYGIQIAEGLAAAHETGVVHRDLKPANILVSEKGSVKILDFGLAKLAAKSLDGVSASTQTMAIAGTPGYLAPEQLHGKPADARSDIFAFGCILYELLSGRRAFPGETLAASLASTAMMEPKPLEGVPWALEELIGRCLRKDPERRLQHIADARVMLEDIRDGGQAESGRRPAVPPAAAWPLVFWLGWIAAAALLVFAIVRLREKPAELPLARFAVEPPPKTVFTTTTTGPSPALVSPDGRRIVFSATSADGNSQLWVRALDALPAQPLPGTGGAAAAFWSPDSRAIVYSTGGKLRKVDLAGGTPLTLADSPGLRGGSWSPAGIIVFAPDSTGALQKVAVAGGTAVPATKLDAARGENTHRFPWFLPDGRHFLFGAGRSNPGPVVAASTGGEEPVAIRIGSLDSTDSKVLLEADSNAIYAEGYLLFLRETTLMAQPFDAKRLALTGEAVPLAEQVQHMFTTRSSFYGLFSASETGLLAYQTGLGAGNLLLTWMDPSGKRLATSGDPTNLGRIQLSPDQKSAAVAVTEGNNTDIWIYDLEHNLRTRFTFDPAVEREAVWSPDGRSIAFSSNGKGHFDLYRKAADGSGVEELLYSDGLDKYPTSWSPDGKFLLYWACCDPKNGFHSWVLPLTAGAKPFALLETPVKEWNPQVSPDGRWVAYQSTESGRGEIYVIPFGPEGGATGGKRQVSTGGGVLSRWRRDGKVLFYIAPDGRLMAAEVESKGGSFAAGQVKALFGPLRVQGYFYDVSADGRRFLVVARGEQATPTEPITVVMNWTAGLKK